MKKNSLSILLLSTALIGATLMTPSCNKGTTNSTEKKVNVVSGNLSCVVPIMTGSGDYDSIAAFTFKMNMDSFVKSFNPAYDTNSIRNVSLTSCQLVLDNKSTVDNFSNFHTANIAISSATRWPLYRIASATDIVDTAAYSLNIAKLYDPNLAKYFTADSISYTLYGNIRRSTSAPLNCKANISFEMTLAK